MLVSHRYVPDPDVYISEYRPIVLPDGSLQHPSDHDVSSTLPAQLPNVQTCVPNVLPMPPVESLHMQSSSTNVRSAGSTIPAACANARGPLEAAAQRNPVFTPVVSPVVTPVVVPAVVPVQRPTSSNEATPSVVKQCCINNPQCGCAYVTAVGKPRKFPPWKSQAPFHAPKQPCSGVSCMLCHQASVEVALLPCGHACTCVACAETLRCYTSKCPMCRILTTGTQRIFL